MASIFNVQSLTCHNDDETTFATAEGSYSGNDIRTVSVPTVTLAQDALEDTTTRQRLGVSYAPIIGLKNQSKLGFSTWMRGTGTAAGNATAALGKADLVEGQLLWNAFGGESLGTGTTVTGVGSTTTSIDGVDTSGISVGQAVMINGEVSVVATNSTNTITLTRALSAAPSADDVIYASATYYPVEDITKTLQFQLKSGEDDWYKLLGCQSVITFADLNTNQIPKINYDFSVASWSAETSASLDLDSYTKSNNPPIPGYASKLYVQDNGTTTINQVDTNSLTINPGLAIEALMSVSGIQGMQGWRRQAIAPTVEMQVNTWSDDYRDDFEAQTLKYIHYQIGSTAGSTVFIEIPAAYVSAMPQHVGVNSQHGVGVNFMAVESGSTFTDLARAAIKVHLL